MIYIDDLQSGKINRCFHQDRYHRVCNNNNTSGATNGTGTSYPSKASEFTPGFQCGLCYSFFSLTCMFCRSLTGADPGFQVRGGGTLKKIAPSGGSRENIWGISCEKNTILRQKIIFFAILGGGGAGCAPPLDPPLVDCPFSFGHCVLCSSQIYGF